MRNTPFGEMCRLCRRNEALRSGNISAAGHMSTGLWLAPVEFAGRLFYRAGYFMNLAPKWPNSYISKIRDDSCLITTTNQYVQHVNWILWWRFRFSPVTSPAIDFYHWESACFFRTYCVGDILSKNLWFFDKSCVPKTVLRAKPLLLAVALLPREALSTGFVKEGNL